MPNSSLTRRWDLSTNKKVSWGLVFVTDWRFLEEEGDDTRDEDVQDSENPSCPTEERPGLRPTAETIDQLVVGTEAIPVSVGMERSHADQAKA